MAVTEREFDDFLLGSASAETKSRVLSELENHDSQASLWMRKIQSTPAAVQDWDKVLELAKSVVYPNGPAETGILPTTPAESHQATRRAAVPWLWAGIALAAGIAGVFIGRAMAPRPEAFRDRELAQASVTIKNAQPRGPAVAVDLELASPRTGFATIVVLSDPPQVFPLRDQSPVTVADSGQYGPVEASPGTALIVIVTETPARETVRRAVEKQLKDGPRDRQSLEDAIREALWREGYHWTAMSHTEIPRS